MPERPVIRDVKSEVKEVLAATPPDPEVQAERLQEEGLLVTGLDTEHDDRPRPVPLVEEDRHEFS